jgi:A/G-specific adenine glycosylase
VPTTDSSVPLRDAAWHQAFRRRLRAWFDRNARDLPWRRTRDPYAVWLSEVMLQQTQVATVIPYFERFLKTFPTIESLARGDEHDVLRLWEGLGYYRRARQLHRAAQVIVAELGGQFPRELEKVRRLPGIGRYTAGAILSIAFDARQPILEANTVRLHSRLLAYRGHPTSAEGRALLWAMADAVLPQRNVGRFNQALMELGGQVCEPRQPHCHACPAAALCQANRQGLQAEVPAAKVKPRVEAVREAAVLVHRRGRVLVLRWPEGRRWAGLWDFPRFAVHAEQPAALRRELVENVRQLTGVAVSPGKRIKTLTHGVTRFRITLDCYQAEYVSCDGKSKAPTPMETRWLRPEALADYALNSTGRKLAKLAIGS